MATKKEILAQQVARAVGARGAAVFGPIGLSADSDPVESLGPVNTERVRAWAGEIAAELGRPVTPHRAGRRSRHTCRHVSAAT